MKTKKIPFLLMLAALFIMSFNASAAVSCAPLVPTKLLVQPYNALRALIAPHVATIKTKLDAIHNQATYATLLAEANADAALTPKGRVTVTLSDGTVVVDTSKGALNTFANYIAKKINENHNSRIAILDAQLYECGVGLETKRSTTDNAIESYVAIRLGHYLDNSGTVRYSKHN
jgi:hypothetical protein